MNKLSKYGLLVMFAGFTITFHLALFLNCEKNLSYSLAVIVALVGMVIFSFGLDPDRVR